MYIYTIQSSKNGSIKNHFILAAVLEDRRKICLETSKLFHVKQKKNPRTILFGGGHNDHELGTYIPTTTYSNLENFEQVRHVTCSG